MPLQNAMRINTGATSTSPPCPEPALSPESSLSLTPLLTRIKAHVREKDASGPASLPFTPIGYEKASANAEAFSS